MKKVLLLLLILLLVGCTKKNPEDYYQLSIDDYLLTVGYDNVEYLRLIYDFDVPESFQANETINDIDVKLHTNFFGIISLNNATKKIIPSKQATLTKLDIYVGDLKGKHFKINNIDLDKSIKSNCDKFNGTYIEKNGYACVIQNKVEDELNVIELYGDYLNINQDELERIIIYVE